MNPKQQPIKIESFYQASFPPYTRGYSAVPKSLICISEETINKQHMILYGFDAVEILKVLKETLVSDSSSVSILLHTPLDEVEFISGIRALRTLLAMALNEFEKPINSKQFQFYLPITNTFDASKNILIAQFSQIDALICNKEEVTEFEQLLNYFPTPPIDALFGSELIEKNTHILIEKVFDLFLDISRN